MGFLDYWQFEDSMPFAQATAVPVDTGAAAVKAQQLLPQSTLQSLFMAKARQFEGLQGIKDTPYAQSIVRGIFAALSAAYTAYQGSNWSSMSLTGDALQALAEAPLRASGWSSSWVGALSRGIGYGIKSFF